jgi:hypothetical protein
MAAEAHFFPKLALAAIACAWLAAASHAESEHWRNVGGQELRELFSDKELADGAHFAYQLKADGTFSGTEMAKSASGTWRVQGEELCWKWRQPAETDECYRVQQDGPHVRFLINGAEAWYGTLEKLR